MKVGTARDAGVGPDRGAAGVLVRGESKARVGAAPEVDPAVEEQVVAALDVRACQAVDRLRGRDASRSGCQRGLGVEKGTRGKADPQRPLGRDGHHGAETGARSRLRTLRDAEVTPFGREVDLQRRRRSVGAGHPWESEKELNAEPRGGDDDGEAHVAHFAAVVPGITVDAEARNRRPAGGRVAGASRWARRRGHESSGVPRGA